MTNDEIIALADQCGFGVIAAYPGNTEMLAKFAALIEERARRDEAHECWILCKQV